VHLSIGVAVIQDLRGPYGRLLALEHGRHSVGRSMFCRFSGYGSVMPNRLIAKGAQEFDSAV
jgi:hypothetical protein